MHEPQPRAPWPTIVSVVVAIAVASGWAIPLAESGKMTPLMTAVEAVWVAVLGFCLVCWYRDHRRWKANEEKRKAAEETSRMIDIQYPYFSDKDK